VCSFAESVGAVHFLTSAKTNKGLEEVFVDLAQSKLEYYPENAYNSTFSRNVRPTDSCSWLRNGVIIMAFVLGKSFLDFIL
jgi:hypothetical protein